jgi:hypothetical protein
MGGAIASSVSQGKDVPVFVFNASPNFAKWVENDGPDRLAIAEYGDFLKAARAFKSEGNQTYVSLNCHRRKGLLWFFHDHDMTRLASCLTWIAARDGNRAAQDSLARNPGIIPPDTEDPALSAPPGWRGR